MQTCALLEKTVAIPTIGKADLAEPFPAAWQYRLVSKNTRRWKFPLGVWKHFCGRAGNPSALSRHYNPPLMQGNSTQLFKSWHITETSVTQDGVRTKGI